jgi:hypothetical protein
MTIINDELGCMQEKVLPVNLKVVQRQSTILYLQIPSNFMHKYCIFICHKIALVLPGITSVRALDAGSINSAGRWICQQ